MKEVSEVGIYETQIMRHGGTGNTTDYRRNNKTKTLVAGGINSHRAGQIFVFSNADKSPAYTGNNDPLNKESTMTINRKTKA